MNSWKQPVPTDINFKPEFTFLDRAIFREILCLCQREDTVLQFIHADRHYVYPIRRGQCILKISRIARELEIDHRRVRRSVEIISKWYSQLESKAMPFGLVVTVKDYDNLIKMDNGMNSSGKVAVKSKESSGRPKESVKSVKTVESGKKEKPKPINEKFLKEMELKFPRVRVRSEYEKFLDYIPNRKEAYKDKRAAFRNWLRRAKEFGSVKGDFKEDYVPRPAKEKFEPIFDGNKVYKKPVG